MGAGTSGRGKPEVSSSKLKGKQWPTTMQWLNLPCWLLGSSFGIGTERIKRPQGLEALGILFPVSYHLANKSINLAIEGSLAQAGLKHAAIDLPASTSEVLGTED